MNSNEYRTEIRKIVKGIIFKNFPGLKRQAIEEVARKIAVNVHARFYGANVDGVGSPIWRDHYITDEANRGQPVISAQEILDEADI